MQGGADVQNLPVILVQVLERCPADIEGSFEIDIHDGAETIWRKLFGFAEEVAGSAIDDDIDFAEPFHGGCDGLLDLVGLANISRDGKGFANDRVRATRVIDCFGRGLEMFNTATDQRDFSARFSQGPRYAARDARAATGHEGHATF